MVTWCSAMAVKSGITCDALDWQSHHKKWTEFVGLSYYNYLTDYSGDYEHARNAYSVIYYPWLSRFFST